MRKYFITHIILFCASLVFSQLPTFQWAVNMGSGSKGDHCLKVDISGNIYLTGFFQSTIDFDPGPGTFTLTADGLEDIFVSKVDASGNFLWAKKMGGKGNDCGLSLSIDGSGNIFTSGYFSDTLDFDPGPGTFTLTADGAKDIYVSKLDANGNFLWAKKMGGFAEEQANSIGLDATGNIYINGYFNNTVDFDPGAGTYTMTSKGMEDIFIEKLDATGNFIWAKQIGGIQSDQALSMVVDGTGNVNSTGYFSDEVDFDPGPAVSTLTANGAKDVFYSKLDASGNFVWGLGFGSYTDDVCYSIALDPAGNLYTTGSYSGYCDFDPGPPSYMMNYLGSTSSIFISKIDLTGNLSWAVGLNSWYSNAGHSIFVDFSGDVFCTGIFGDAMDFNPGPGTFYMTPVTSFFGATDVYVLKLNSFGTFMWAKSFGGIWWDDGRSIYAEFPDNVFINGSYNGTADFDPGMNIANLSPGGGFINKLGPCVTTPSAPINTTLINDQIICSGSSTTLTATGAGSIYWYPTATSFSIINSGSTFITPSLTTGTYTYYAVAATCTVSSRTPVTVTVNACVGINEVIKSDEGIVLFPNPNNGSFTLKIGNEIKNGELMIINSIGQKVFEQKIVTGINPINIKSISAGLYQYVLLQDSQRIFHGKFVMD